MKEHEFFKVVSEPFAGGDPWSSPVQEALDLEIVHQLERGSLPGDDDLGSAISLTRIVHTQYQAYGTDGSQTITDTDARDLLKALRRVLTRHGIALDVPWRDFNSFRTHWIREDCAGSWQARRDLLEKHFGPVLEALEAAEEDQFRAELAGAVSPRDQTGWSRVDTEVDALRIRFRTAAIPQDYRDVGNRAVAVLEALSATVFDPTKHLADGQVEPPIDKTNIRIEAYINSELPGGVNEDLRGLAKKASALAHRVKHSSTGSRRDAGIIADAVILLANMLRRLETSD